MTIETRRHLLSLARALDAVAYVESAKLRRSGRRDVEKRAATQRAHTVADAARYYLAGDVAAADIIAAA